MRAADPVTARSVDEAIKSIPFNEGVPVRIDVPGAPPSREYLAILPSRRDAPAVIYRSLEPSEDPDGGGWLVTTLIDRAEFGDYRHAELTGILDDPVVSQVAASVAGTVSSIVSGSIGQRSGAAGG